MARDGGPGLGVVMWGLKRWGLKRHETEEPYYLTIPRENIDANGQLIRNMEPGGRVASMWEMEWGPGDCPFKQSVCYPLDVRLSSSKKRCEETYFHVSHDDTEVEYG